MSKTSKFMKSSTGKAWLIQKIAEKDKAKSAKRRRYSINLMKQYKGLYDCADCIHGLIKSCLDHLPNGCEYFSNEVTGRRFEAC